MKCTGQSYLHSTTIPYVSHLLLVVAFFAPVTADSYMQQGGSPGDLTSYQRTSSSSLTSRLLCAIHCERENCAHMVWSDDAMKCHLYSSNAGTSSVVHGEVYSSNTCVTHSSSGLMTIPQLGEFSADACTGGWITFLRRIDGAEDFYRNWADYKAGFGNKRHEFWLGLDVLAELTAERPYELRAEMLDFSGNYYHAEWDAFHVANESLKYRLALGTYDAGSTAGDCLSGADTSLPAHWEADGMFFSTKDVDNDNSAVNHCAQVNACGGFWYHGCVCANPTGVYGSSANSGWCGVYWHTLSNSNNPVKQIELKMKPV